MATPGTKRREFTDVERARYLDEYEGVPRTEKKAWLQKHRFTTARFAQWKHKLGRPVGKFGKRPKAPREKEETTNGAPKAGPRAASRELRDRIEALTLENTVLKAMAKLAIQKGILD